MQQQAAAQLLTRALSVRCRLEAVRLLQRIGMSLYAGQNVALDKLAAGDKRLRLVKRPVGANRPRESYFYFMSAPKDINGKSKP